MEKRFILAIILSFFVLYIWSATAMGPRKPQGVSDDLQIAENNEFKNAPDSALTALVSQEIQTPPPPSAEEIYEIAGSKINLKISNIGGSIKGFYISDHKTSLPVHELGEMTEFKNVVFSISSESLRSLVLSGMQGDVKITRSYKISEDDYIVQSETTLTNTSNSSKLINPSLSVFTLDPSRLDNLDPNHTKNNRDDSLFEYSVASEGKIFRKGNALKFSGKDTKANQAAVEWVGFRDRYYCAIYKPRFETAGYEIATHESAQLQISSQIKPIVLEANKSLEYSSVLYLGPQQLSLLKKYDEGFEQIMRFSGFGLFDAISKFIYFLMHLIYKVIPNWGVCIILVSFIIYFAMYPLTLRGMSSMKKMQSIQPKVVALKEKHKDNPQKLNQEMMEIYKREKINPLGGCFPFLLQMPVFIGLYQVLWRSVDFKGANFLWIKDLSEPDRLFMFSKSFPVVGNEFNILPIVMMAVMFLQQKISAKNMNITDPAQLAQQKMMATIMPVFLGFIFYKFASGLTLYFTVFYSLSTLTQWKMSKTTKVA